MIKPSFEILNQKGTPMFYSDVYANIPTAGIVGRMFISTDTYAFYRDTGSGWDLIGGPGTGTITGSGATGQVSFFNGASTIGGSNNLFWDSANNRLGIGTATPGVQLDIHTTGTGLSINGTTTNNSFATFQNAGTGKWRIGNNYSTGSNYFSIYDVLNSTERLKIENTGAGTYTGAFTISGITTLGNNLVLPANNTVGGTNYNIKQVMATNDYWSIYGNTLLIDQSELIFELGDNGQPIATNGQRFRFYYNAVSSGSNKDVLTIDYNDSIFLTTLTANSFIKSGGTSSQFLKADGTIDSNTYLTTSSASTTYLALSGGTLTGGLNGTSASFTSTITTQGGFNCNNGTPSNSAGNGNYLGLGNGGGTTSNNLLQAGVGQFILFGYSGSNWIEYITIKNSNGNVLIGKTTDSGYKLQVNGSSQADRFTTNESTVAVSGSATTIFDTGGGSGVWIVTAVVTANGPQAGYAIVGQRYGSTLYLLSSGVGGQMTFSVTGNTLQLSQSAGGTVNTSVSVLRINQGG